MQRTNIQLDINQIIDMVTTAQDGLINYIKRAELSNDSYKLLFEAFKELDRAHLLLFNSKIVF